MNSLRGSFFIRLESFVLMFINSPHNGWKEWLLPFPAGFAVILLFLPLKPLLSGVHTIKPF
jgi:hypothetical protein